MLGEVGEAFAGVNDVAVVAEMIFTGFGTALVGDRIGRAKIRLLPTSTRW